MRGSHISLSDCLDDQFGVWNDQGSNRKTSNKSQTTSSEMRVAGNASSSYKHTGQAGPGQAGLNIIDKQIYKIVAGLHKSSAGANLSFIDKKCNFLDMLTRVPTFTSCNEVDILTKSTQFHNYE